MYKKQKRGHNRNIQLIKKLDKEILILPLSIPPFYNGVEWGIFVCWGGLVPHLVPHFLEKRQSLVIRKYLLNIKLVIFYFKNVVQINTQT